MKKQVTLEEIEQQQIKTTELIAQFKKQVITQFMFPETAIELAHGEEYAGVIIGKDGESSYHLILLPEEKESIKWQDAVDWAKSIGGELPTRREQSLLFANLKEKFKEQWYWSGETPAAFSGYAWCQGLDRGTQTTYIKINDSRARAVRRLVIE